MVAATAAETTAPVAAADHWWRHVPGRMVTRWWAVLIFAIPGIAVTVDVPYSNSPPIRSDGLGYHLWTRALLDGELTFCDHRDVPELATTISETLATGRCANQYPIGLALLRFPVMAPFTAANGGQLRSPGEDAVVQWTSLLAGAIAVVGGVALARRAGTGDLFANIGGVVATFGTGLFHAATYEASFSHAWNAALITSALLVAWRLWDVTPRSIASFVGGAALLAVVCAAAVAVRATSGAVLGSIAATSALVALRAGGPAALRRAFPVLAVAGAGIAAGALGVMAVNHHVSGTWTLSGYAATGFGFSFADHHGVDVLFSIRKGMFTWYPAMGVAVLASAAARRWSLVALLAAATLPLVAIYGAWVSWDLAGGFGHRGFIDIAPLFGVALAAALASLGWTGRIVAIAAGAIAVSITLSLMVAYWMGEVGFYGAEYAEWRHYGWGRGSIPARLLDRLGLVEW